ncbi:MAG: PilZ domain-containing protein [Lachnospiraceae bacterium]|nr:PilZ domain-containing protein [Lachnospiraceae bacterium]
MAGQERRKSERMELRSSIVLKRLDQGGSDEKVDIDVSDVSKTGVGFSCNTPLTIGAVYEAFLTIWTKEVLHAFLEIVRIEKANNTFNYGAIFIGMPETESERISIYQTIKEVEKDTK